jgi:FlaG/FlaF family flagellin (archaellin)
VTDRLEQKLGTTESRRGAFHTSDDGSDRQKGDEAGLRNRTERVRERSRQCRASVPVLGMVLLAGTTVVLAATVAGAGFALEDAASTEPTPTATFSASASGDRITLIHEGGEPLDVEALTLRISVDGEDLNRQPEVPFFSQRGFHPGPTGPFNSAGDETWTVGERASLRVAGSNEPSLEPGATVEIRIVSDGTELAQVSTTVTE